MTTTEEQIARVLRKMLANRRLALIDVPETFGGGVLLDGGRTVQVVSRAAMQAMCAEGLLACNIETGIYRPLTRAAKLYLRRPKCKHG
jgi:hypothetical protein